MLSEKTSIRELTFEGSVNVRDLGGIRTQNGQPTKMKRIIRSDSVEAFTKNDWANIEDYGVRTVIDLRFKHEIKGDLFPRPERIKTVHISLDGGHDPPFWKKWRETGKWSTPLYYKAHLERFPEITTSVLSQIANCSTGAVLFHCASGRDRTGLITFILLCLANVSTLESAKDHSLSHKNLSKLYASKKEVDQKILIEKLLFNEGKNTQQIFDEILESIDIDNMLLENGLTRSELKALKNKLV